MKCSQYGWVIEKGEIAAPEYLTLRDTPGWSQPGDHLAALRFEREEDAEAFVSSFVIGVTSVDRDAVRVAQHGWS